MRLERTFSESLQGRNLKPVQSGTVTDKTMKVGFLLLTHFSLPSFTQSLDTLVTANLIRTGSFEFFTFGLEEGDVVSDLGIPIKPGQVLRPGDVLGLDLLVVCGGLRTPCNTRPHLSSILKKASDQGVALSGLWNGAWFLADAGLLNGYRCAIHPEQRLALTEIAPATQVTNVTHMVDRDRLTAASPNGAFYMILEWIGRLYDSGLVNGIVDILAFDMSRVRAVTRSRYRNLAAPVQEVISLMEANLEEPLSMDQMAHYVKKSRRQIERLFSEQLGTTPQRYYLELRVTEARRLLQHSSKSIIEVSLACGFVSSSHFSKCYTAYFGHRPSKEIRLDRRMDRQEPANTEVVSFQIEEV
ncbi:GlxA family transcriptional regulator [Pseudomonas matsuisoli]|uniref:Transcriptional regulator n=1 Tax=Pseudomonas matsuisoli TaxID=1515666 RepID=A0A917V0W9_9PSED|nr:GlxA family transcriptional regulator [Pseudomonas matsuisoli]GGK08920.1 transcriptional regulator [Pseudomonas matsuisoli]